MNEDKIGIAGKIAAAFIKSKLTPILVLLALMIGIFVTVLTPREEEPQIIVPMIDIFVSDQGASPAEVENQVTKPMEKLLWEIPGVEYIYSTVKPSSNLTIVRFKVNENAEDSLVKLYTKLMANFDRIPQNVSQPLIKERSIDDVPVLALTFWSSNGMYTSYDLRRMAVEVADELKKSENVAEINVIGGQKRQLRIEFDSAALANYGLSSSNLVQAIGTANVLSPTGTYVKNNKEYIAETGSFLANKEDFASLLVGVDDGRPIFLRDVAQISDAPEEANSYVFLGNKETNGEHEAVTVTVAKQKGTNATNVANDMLSKVQSLKGVILPHDVEITITRNYGETAKDKANELLEHMLLATVSVIFLIALTLGKREAVVVAVAVPVTLSLTLLVNYLYGYTLNRVTLFALIFSIGILVDDAIVVVENIHRHFKLYGASEKVAIKAVDEVGNPTILATFTVIAALLPMAFVSGLMGPYMRPIPVGASAAMIFSLLVAFVISPWLSYIVLKNVKTEGVSINGGIKDITTVSDAPGKIHQLYQHIMQPLLESKLKRRRVLFTVAFMLVLACLLVPFKAVKVKMLPFDNKSELQVIVDLPEGSTLENTAAFTHALGSSIKAFPEVANYQSYIGTAAPYNFNGLVRHYFLRNGSNMADIQVNFLPKSERSLQSHDIAKKMRIALNEVAKQYGGKIKVVEIPPGPPVASTMVAEIYGPEQSGQIAVAKKLQEVFLNTDGVVDTDIFVESDQPKTVFVVDKVKAGLSGVGTQAANDVLTAVLKGIKAGVWHLPREKEPVEVFLHTSYNKRAGITDNLQSIYVAGTNGQLVPLSYIVEKREAIEAKTIYHKNLKNVTYVVGDLAGEAESPVYAILDMKDKISALDIGTGYVLEQYSTIQPRMTDKYAMKWDGEWHITYETFRDMGIAFAAVLLLIYILVVAWFKNFITPLIIMVPIPLTLVGILPGHFIFGAFFTATSMIGFIALSGIIVRNSILLIDFVELEMEKSHDLKMALIEAGATRFLPIVLTAAAVVVGSFVMLFDPIFQGLAIAMMFGAVAATALTLLAIPLLYYEVYGDNKKISKRLEKQ